MTNGSLSLSFTDLALPGNAGMDLRIGRSYLRQQSRQWEFGIQGVPTHVVYPDGISGSCCNPVFFTFDGSKHTAYPVGGGVYLTKEFWRYTVTSGSRKLQMPNGWTVSFELGTNAGGSMMTKVEDVFDNLIEATWNGSGSSTNERPLTLDTVTQTLGPSKTRTISFEYEDSTCPSGMPSKMTYGDREWVYGCEYTEESFPHERLITVTPPLGPGWVYTYTGDINTGKIKVTTPTGGWVRYEFEDRQLPSGGTHRPVIKKREIGEGETATDPWNFSFSEVSPGIVGTVTLPGAGDRSIVYSHELTSDESWFLVGKVLRTGTSTPVDISTLTRVRSDIPFVYGSGTALYVPAEETIVQDSRTYTRTYYYNPTNFGDYGQAYQITDTGDFTRVTMREFQDSFTPWLTNRVKQVSVSVGSETFTDNWTYTGATGFLESQTVRGVHLAFAPDDFGNVGSVTNGKFHSTTFDYEWGTLKTTTTAEGHVTDRSINSDGTVASETRDGYTTTFGYDDMGRPSQVQPPLVAGHGDPTNTEYDLSDGRWIKVSTGPTWTKTFLDAFGRPNGTENAVGVKTTTTYDVDGRVVFQSLPFTGSSGPGETTTFDALSRVASVTHPNSTVTTYAYSSNSSSPNTITQTDAFSDGPNHVRVETWYRTGSPAGGRMASVVDAEGQLWTYSYNAIDQLTSLGQPGGSTRTWHYFSTGQLDYETHPESGTVSYTYDLAGNVYDRNDAKSQTIHYVYDDDERLIGIETPTSSHDVTQDVHNTRNLRESLATGPTGSRITTEFHYDAAGRLERRDDVMGGHTFETSFAYDYRGNLAKLTYPSGREVRYEWDNADRLADVSEWSGPHWASSFSYHASGGLAGYTAVNGQSVSISYYDDARPHVLTSGPLSLTYDYWQSGNVKTLTDGRGSSSSQSFSYDKLDRLTGVSGAGSGSFGYDPRGNRNAKNSTSYTYSGARLSNDGAKSYSYDNNGNTTAAGSTSFDNYSPFNMPGSTTTSSVTTSYRYDGDGERRMRTQGGITEYFIPGVTYEPLAEYKEVSGVLTLVREYIYGNGQLIASEGLVPTALSPVSFTDNPIVADTTSLKAVHITELRSAINDARAAAGLTAASWTDATITAGTTAMAPVHITEMRTALSAAYTAFGLSAPSFTDSTLTADTTAVKAVHLQELRDAYLLLTTTMVKAKAFYHLDAVGSVRAITNIAGDVVERHDYAPFGEELTSPVGIDARRFGGKDRDAETGLAYFNARYYEPSVGRFTRADETGFGSPFEPQSMNQYGYTAGNPMRWADPTGHFGQSLLHFETTETVKGIAPVPTNFWAFFTNFTGSSEDGGQGPAKATRNEKQKPLCKDLPSNVLSVGVGGTIGGSLMPFVSPFFGGGVSIGVSYPGWQAVVTFQGNVMAGPGVFIGGGAQVSGSTSANGVPAGWSPGWEKTLYAEGNASWEAAGVGGSIAANKDGLSASYGLKQSSGFGIMSAAGVSMSRTWATPGLACRGK